MDLKMLAALCALSSGSHAAAAAPGQPVQPTWQELSGYTNNPTTFGMPASIYPPWNPPPADARNFTVPEVDNVPDLQGDVVDPQLVIYFNGNQYMVIDDLVSAFKTAHPDIKRVFAVTLPPGILMDAVKNHGGAFSVGNLRVALKPDVLTNLKSNIAKLQAEASAFSSVVDYADNDLALMVAKGNPRGIHSFADFSKPGLRISMPNPTWEGIAKQIELSFVKVGGNALDQHVMDTKVKDGSTFLTHIHHRQSPMRMMAGKSDVAPVWSSEALYHSRRAGENIDMVVLPADQRSPATYSAGAFRAAPHAAAAKAFLDFLVSPQGQAVYRKYGFEPAGALIK